MSCSGRCSGSRAPCKFTNLRHVGYSGRQQVLTPFEGYMSFNSPLRFVFNRLGCPLLQHLKGLLWECHGSYVLKPEQANARLELWSRDGKIVTGGTSEVGVAPTLGTIEIAQAIANGTRVARDRHSKVVEEPSGRAVDGAISFHGKGNWPVEILIETIILSALGIHIESSSSANPPQNLQS